MPHFSIEVGDLKEAKVEPYGFVKDLMCVDDAHFIIYEMEAEEYSLQINYSEWDSYKEGVEIGEEFRENKNVMKELRKWKNRSHRTKEKLYKKYLFFEGFMEGYTTRNMDIMAPESWDDLLERLEFTIEYVFQIVKGTSIN